MNTVSSSGFLQNQTIELSSQGMKLRSGKVLPNIAKQISKRKSNSQSSSHTNNQIQNNKSSKEEKSLYKLQDTIKGVVGSFLCLKDVIQLAKVARHFRATNTKFVMNDAQVSEILRKAHGKISAIPEPLRTRVKEIAHIIKVLDLNIEALSAEDVDELIMYFKNSNIAQYRLVFKVALQDVLQENSKDEKIKILLKAIDALSVENSQLKVLLLQVMRAVEEESDLQGEVKTVLEMRHLTTFTDSMKEMHRLVKELTSKDAFFNVHRQEARLLLKDAEEGTCLFRPTSLLASERETGQFVITVKRSDLMSIDDVPGFYEALFDINVKGELFCDDNDSCPVAGTFKDVNEILQTKNLKLKARSEEAM